MINNLLRLSRFRSHSSRYLLLAVFIFSSLACNDKSSSNTEPNPPSNSRAYVSIMQASATYSTPFRLDKKTAVGIKFQWRQVKGPGKVTFSDSDHLDTSISADIDGSYEIALTASDEEGRTAEDSYTFIWDTSVNVRLVGQTEDIVDQNLGAFNQMFFIEVRPHGGESIAGVAIETTPYITSQSGERSNQLGIKAEQDGDYELLILVTDQQGKQRQTQLSFRWDTTGPELDAPSNLKLSPDRTITIQCRSECEDGKVAWTSTNDSLTLTQSYNDPFTVSVSGYYNGETSVTVQATDKLGNLTEKTIAVDYQTGAITLNFEETTQSANKPVEFKLSEDSLSYLDTLEWTFGYSAAKYLTAKKTDHGLEIASSKDGTYYIEVEARDEYGREASKTLTLQWDTLAPVISDLKDLSSGTRNVNLFASVSSDYESSSISWTFLKTPDNAIANLTPERFSPNRADFQTNRDGLYQITFAVSDKAGNRAEKTISVLVDTLAPTLSIDQKLTDFDKLYTNQPVTITLKTSADAQQLKWSAPSGVTIEELGSNEFRLSAAEDNKYPITFTTNDGINEGSLRFYLVWDTKAPVLAGWKDIVYTNQPESLWSRYPEKLKLMQWRHESSESDDPIQFINPQDLSTKISAKQDGAYPLSLKLVDLAGNEVIYKTTFVWDTMAPTLDLNINSTVTDEREAISINQPLRIEPKAEDTNEVKLSYVTVFKALYPAPDSGPFTIIKGQSEDLSDVIVISASDAAGNKTSKVLDVEWKVSGPSLEISNLATKLTVQDGDTLTTDQDIKLALAGDFSKVSLEPELPLESYPLTWTFSDDFTKLDISTDTEAVYPFTLVATDSLGNQSRTKIFYMKKPNVLQDVKLGLELNGQLTEIANELPIKTNQVEVKLFVTGLLGVNATWQSDTPGVEIRSNSSMQATLSLPNNTVSTINVRIQEASGQSIHKTIKIHRRTTKDPVSFWYVREQERRPLTEANGLASIRSQSEFQLELREWNPQIKVDLLLSEGLSVDKLASSESDDVLRFHIQEAGDRRRGRAVFSVADEFGNHREYRFLVYFDNFPPHLPSDAQLQLEKTEKTGLTVFDFFFLPSSEQNISYRLFYTDDSKLAFDSVDEILTKGVEINVSPRRYQDRLHIRLESNEPYLYKAFNVIASDAAGNQIAYRPVIHDYLTLHYPNSVFINANQLELRGRCSEEGETIEIMLAQETFSESLCQKSKWSLSKRIPLDLPQNIKLSISTSKSQIRRTFIRSKQWELQDVISLGPTDSKKPGLFAIDEDSLTLVTLSPDQKDVYILTRKDRFSQWSAPQVYQDSSFGSCPITTLTFIEAKQWIVGRDCGHWVIEVLELQDDLVETVSVLNANEIVLSSEALLQSKLGAIAYRNDTLLIGDANDSFDATGFSKVDGAGAVYILQRTSKQSPFTLVRKLVAPSSLRTKDGAYGRSVAIGHDNYIYVGALKSEETNDSSGNGYVQILKPNADLNDWHYAGWIRAQDLSEEQRGGFATALAVSKDFVYIGAPSASINNSRTGAVHVYPLAENLVTVIETLLPPGSISKLDQSRFGERLSVRDGWLLVDTPFSQLEPLSDEIGQQTGALFVYSERSSRPAKFYQSISYPESVSEGLPNAVMIGDHLWISGQDKDSEDKRTNILYPYHWLIK